MSNNPLNAVGDIFRWVPVKVRRAIYGLLGLVILTDGIFDYLGDDWGPKVLALFGLVGSLMALANTTSPPLPPPVPTTGGVTPEFPDEFA